MSVFNSALPETLGLLFVLGMRHGLDPDHVAVIDNITFRALDERPKAAPWTGFLFAFGHTASVLAIAILFGLLGTLVQFPAWFETAMTYFVIGLFLVIGTLNLRALLTSGPYVPMGWRHGALPKILRGSTHPLVTVVIGLFFGLVIDTAAQIAAWGATAASSGGVFGALLVGLSFAAGMILIDSLDSLIVTQLVSGRGDPDRARGYRRGVGWVIVVLSFAMAAWSILGLTGRGLDLSDSALLIIGCVISIIVITLSVASLIARRRALKIQRP